MSATPWTRDILARVDDAHDRDFASDRYSRYGAYLNQHLGDFHEYGEPSTPLTAPEFAAAAWRVATSPVMSPGYVRIRPDIDRITPFFTEEGRLMLRVMVPLVHGDLAGRVPGSWRDWEADRYGDAEDGTYARLLAPDDRQAVLVTAEARVIVDHVLIEPQHVCGPGLLSDARQAVQILADYLNKDAAPAVDALQRPTTRRR